MTERQRFEKVVRSRQPVHASFFERPHLSRRCFFRDSLSGLAGSFLCGLPAMAETTSERGAAQPRNTARNVIFLFMRGGPSHVDTFDFKHVEGVTPSYFAPETFGDITIPMFMLGNTSRVLDKIAIVRSAQAWARAHPLAQQWMQIGRDPSLPIASIAPHIGSVVALEKEAERQPRQLLPGFIALNAGNIGGQGYLDPKFGPVRAGSGGRGLANTEHPDGLGVFQRRWSLMQAAAAAGPGLPAYYEQARAFVSNPDVTAAFSYTQEEWMRYGGTKFGGALLTARKIIEQDLGTRFIQVGALSWDHHDGIYPPNSQQLYGLPKRMLEFDPAFAALIEDLDASGRLAETLVLACGEFGRTPGKLSNVRLGRDHYQQMFYVLAGGGVQGGTVIGATNGNTGGRGPGSFTTEYGWSRERDVRPEDIEATIYSALGIDWTTTRLDDPLGRGYRYVPLSDEDVYTPLDELWAS